MTKRVSDLTVEEFRTVLREEIQHVLREIFDHKPKRPLLDIPVLDVGPWPEDLSLRREDMYGDDGR